MPGFVDVSNMSDLEIKRLGQADDYDQETERFGRVAPPRNNSVQIGYSVSDVWAAACAAQRINDGYFRESVFEWDEASNANKFVKRRNRDVMMEFLAAPECIPVEDVNEAERVRNFLQSDLTFRAVKGQLTDFDSATNKCLAVQDRFYTVSHRYELAVIACLPQSVQRSQQQQEVNSRVQFSKGDVFGTVGEKVQLNIEVLSSVYAKTFNIYWIRAITDADQVISFSNKKSFGAGTHLTISGKIKGHRDRVTQLNYVKVI